MSEEKYLDPVECWREFSYAFQITNIGTELGRAIRCKREHRYESMFHFLNVVMRQIDYTLNDPKNENQIEELTRIREDIYKYFGSPYYWYLKKRIIGFFNSYIHEYVNEVGRI